MNYKEIVMARYAAKSFDGKKIPEDKINELLEIIRFSPTSYNLQPWKVNIIQDSSMKEKIQLAAWNQPQVSSCSHLFVFYANTALEVLATELEKQLLKEGVPEEKVGAFIGIVRKFVESIKGEARLAWAQRQTYLALANGLNGAKALGFDSCPMEGVDFLKVKELLKPAEFLVPTVLMPVGYASDNPPPKNRFPKEQMFI